MYLTRVRAESWRALRDAVELAELSPGLNVVHGPNETGKSTLMDAICRGFFDRHKTAGVAMLGRRPWGTELGPRVAVDFAVGDDRYRLEKRFLDGASTVLHRLLDGGGMEKLAENQRADDRLLELASGRAAPAGLTKPEHWGLCQILWAGQGEATRLAVGDDQQARLREALRVTLDAGPAAAVEAEVRRRYDAVFTPEGKVRSGRHRPELAKLGEELAAADAEAARLAAERSAADRAADDLRSALADRDAAAAVAVAAKVALAAATDRQVATAEAAATYQRLAGESAAAKAAWRSLNDAAGAIRTADEAAAAGRRAAVAAEAAHATAVDAAGVTAARLAAATVAREAARDRLAAVDEAGKAAARRATFLACGDDAAAVASRLAGIAVATADLAAAAARRAGLRAPTADQMDALRRLDRRRQDVHVRLDAASLTVTVEPARPLDVRLEVDGVADPAGRRIGAPESVRATSRMAIDIAGVGRVLVRAGASDAGAMAAELGRLDGQWAAAVAPFAAADLPALEQLGAELAAVEQAVTHLRGTLAGAGDPAALAGRAADLAEQRQSLLADDPALADAGGDAAAAKAAVAQMRVDRQPLKGVEKAAEAALSSAQDEAARAGSAATAAVAGRDKARAVADERDGEAGRLRRADGLDDAARAAGLSAALDAADAAGQRLSAVPEPAAEAADRDVAAHRRRVADADAALATAEQRVGHLRGRVGQTEAAGLYSQWAAAAERAEGVRARLARARLDADAVKLLRATVDRHRQRVFEAVLDPVRERVTATMGRVAGPRYDRVDFDDRLQPAGVRPTGVRPAGAGVGGAVGGAVAATLDDLSFGTREQLMLLVRLALAGLLSRSAGRQCVILDDPLVNADPGRQAAALALLSEAAVETQVIVFTCHPHAYDVAGAKRFDLAALAAAARPVA